MPDMLYYKHWFMSVIAQGKNDIIQAREGLILSGQLFAGRLSSPVLSDGGVLLTASGPEHIAANGLSSAAAGAEALFA